MCPKSLYIDSVEHAYAGRIVLAGAYFECVPGEVVGLLGRNGAGKTTFLKILFGDLRADFKFQKVNGKRVHKAYTTKELACLTQENFIPGSLKLGTAIDIFCKGLKKEIKDIDGISDKLNFRMNELSGGMRRFAECLVVLYSDASFILLDEPFSQLAPVLIEKIKQHINILKDKKGIIITDHYYQDVLDCTTRIVLLHNGSNYAINSEADLRQHGYLRQR